MDTPETRYARSGDVSIAYQVLGDGPFDLVRIPPFVYHVELAWQIPSLAADANVHAKTGKVLLVGELAKEYAFTDVDGRLIPPFEM